MFVVLPDLTEYTADNLPMESILLSFKKEDLQKTAKKVDAYFSPRHDKARLVDSIVDMVSRYPENLLGIISKTEYPLLIELVEETDPTKYIQRPMRKSLYSLMSMGFVATHVDEENKKWHILMPTKLKEILRPDLPVFKDIYEQGLPIPKGKEARFMLMMNEFAKAKTKKQAQDQDQAATDEPTQE